MISGCRFHSEDGNSSLCRKVGNFPKHYEAKISKQKLHTFYKLNENKNSNRLTFLVFENWALRGVRRHEKEEVAAGRRKQNNR
jgi:hypothetical protein